MFPASRLQVVLLTMVPTPEEVLVVWCRRAIKMDRACGLSFIGAVRVRVSGLQWYGTDRSNLLWTSLLSPNLPTNVLLVTTLRRSKGTGKTRENGQYFTCGSKTRVGQDRRLPLPATGVMRTTPVQTTREKGRRSEVHLPIGQAETRETETEEREETSGDPA